MYIPHTACSYLLNMDLFNRNSLLSILGVLLIVMTSLELGKLLHRLSKWGKYSCTSRSMKLDCTKQNTSRRSESGCHGPVLSLVDTDVTNQVISFSLAICV